MKTSEPQEARSLMTTSKAKSFQVFTPVTVLMRMPRSLLFLIVTVLTIQVSTAQNSGKPVPRKAAIFVENRSDAGFNNKVPVLEDFLTSRITEKGFSVISREIAINALKTYPAAEITSSAAKTTKVEVADSRGKGEADIVVASAAAAQIAATSPVTTLDRLLNDNTSALRLAQNLGVDYLFVASITSFGSERKSYEDAGLKTVNLIHTLRVSYKVLEAAFGGSLIADTIKVSKTTRYTENSHSENSDIINELLDEAATQLAENAGKKQTAIAAASPVPKVVEVTFACGMQDLVNLPISVPDIRVLEDGSLRIETNGLNVQVLDATIEVNGTAVGSAPGKFKVPPGLNKIRITREGFKDWERTANFSEGQKFNVALQMSEAGYARWKDNTAFLFGLETGKKMTDATVKMMEGFAQTLRQSGFRIDIRNDSKGKSLFDGAVIKPSLFNKPE